MGAQVISNSYGAAEPQAVKRFNADFNHPGHVLTAASGDTGFGLSFPASSQYVTAVGGTRLVRSSSARGWSETVWRGTGSGCSTVFPKPSWQKDLGCSRRTVGDVSAVADPATGVAIYHTFGVRGGPWFKAGGTSVSTPIIAGAYALAGNATSVHYGSFPYSHSGSLHDITMGANGSCGGSYLCTAMRGYDGPSGLGTPNGSGAF
jgi:subtilase family serine protease